MSMITFSENHESCLVPFEDGEPLASLRDPREEGLKWVYSLGSIPTSHVVVVGLGSGFHVAALSELDPGLKITVVDSREALIPVFRAQFPELKDRVEIVVVKEASEVLKSELLQEIIHNRSYVLSFRECWGSQINLLSQAFSHLTGRSVESLKYHFDDFGVNIKALYLKPKHLLSIKDIMPIVEAAPLQPPQKQIFRILDELVK